jgi:pyridoxal phosphate enzyme (YggS family)
MSAIADNLAAVSERIAGACARAGRPSESVSLMAVSKRQPTELIAEAARLGLRLFGESRVQETRARRGQFPEDARVHFIGHLQRNKARDAVELYDAIDSIDTFRIAQTVSAQLERAGRTMRVLIEVNTSGEPQKYGVTGRSALLALAEEMAALPGIAIGGLMTIGPISTNEDELRRAFATLRELRDSTEEHLGRPLPELSMGMSNDLEAAILEGATTIRIGTALFGARA